VSEELAVEVGVGGGVIVAVVELERDEV